MGQSLGCLGKLLRILATMQTYSRDWTGISSPHTTLMAMNFQGLIIECGGKPGLTTEEFSTARGWMPTGTGDSTGTKGVPAMTSAVTTFTATASSSSCPGDSSLHLQRTTT